jgi:hypothetical protein
MIWDREKAQVRLVLASGLPGQVQTRSRTSLGRANAKEAAVAGTAGMAGVSNERLRRRFHVDGGPPHSVRRPRCRLPQCWDHNRPFRWSHPSTAYKAVDVYRLLTWELDVSEEAVRRSPRGLEVLGVVTTPSEEGRDR